MAQSTEFNDELLAYLQRCLELRPEGRTWVWVMSEEWLLDIRNLTDKQGRPLFPGPGWPETIYGYRIQVREGAGAPQLEGRDETLTEMYDRFAGVSHENG